jgi:homoserine/homoserine lactone efflux protein
MAMTIMELSVWATFFLASWAISISPGAGAVAAMNAGLQYGVRRGYVMTIGLVLGIMTQMLCVALGLGALVATSTTAFSLIKWGGVAYLIVLGLQQWRASATSTSSVAESTTPAIPPTEQNWQPWSLIARGWMINTMNPKGTVFLLAVVPQFLNLHHDLAPQYSVIAATLAFTDLVIMGVYTALAAKLLRQLNSARAMRWLNRGFGSLFILAGASLALFKRQT